jgi:2-iminobutanoate/2-iminopropanoate deaminase
MREVITSPTGAPPQGVYSPAIKARGTMVFVSGQRPVNPATGQIELGTFMEQASLTFDNVTTLLTAAGATWENVVRVGVFLADLNHFAEMNDIYRAHYAIQAYPAHTTVQTGLLKGMLIEVDCIAFIPEA